MKTKLAFFFIMVCLPLMAVAQQAKAVRPILDLTPQIVIRDDLKNITIDEGREGSASRGVTFVVDENLPAPESDKYSTLLLGEKELAQQIAENAKVLNPKEGFVASSFRNESMQACNDDVLYSTMLRCFATHRPLVLSPDMVWIVIAQNFSYYVNENAEQLRDKLVSHDGKIDLVVNSDEDLVNGSPDWEAVFSDFEKQIALHSRNDAAQTLTADFTTTGPTERIASQITLMDAMKQYFEYVVHRLACGIPTVTLLGTPEDWQKVHDKAMKLKKLGMGWYAKDLDPILKEFVRAAKGKANQAFWQDMVMKNTPLRLRGGACSGEMPTELDGWFLKLFPYDKDGVRTQTTVAQTRHMLSEMVNVPFRYVVTAPTGEKLSDTSMTLYAGLVGVKEDPTTLALTPQIGWMVRKAEDPNAQNDKLLAMLNKQNGAGQADEDNASGSKGGLDIVLGSSSGGLELRVKEVPEALRKCKVIDRLTLYFVDGVRLPEWMDNIQFNSLTAHGKVTEKEAAKLKQRFPYINLDTPVDKKTPERKSSKSAVTEKTGAEVDMQEHQPLLKLDSVVINKDGRVTTHIAEYDSLCRLKTFCEKGESLRNNVEYDAQGRPLRLHVSHKDGRAYKVVFVEYDERGNKVLMSDSLLSPDIKHYEKFHTYAFAYDEANRLTTKDVHEWRKDGKAWHHRYAYRYNKKGVLSEVLKYEYFLDAPWARMKDVRQQIRTELQERATYNKQGRIALYEDLLNQRKHVYHYDKEGILTNSESFADDVVVSVTQYYYDRRGNLIARDVFDGDEELMNTCRVAYYNTCKIDEVAGLSGGFYKQFLPIELQGDEFFRPEFANPFLNVIITSDYGNDRTTYQYFYSFKTSANSLE